MRRRFGDAFQYAAREPSLFNERKLVRDTARAELLAHGLPLYGVPFVVKDNIDVAGLPTTAACPAFAFEPSTSAEVVWGPAKLVWPAILRQAAISKNIVLVMAGWCEVLNAPGSVHSQQCSEIHSAAARCRNQLRHA